jgi:hypothetical protein
MMLVPSERIVEFSKAMLELQVLHLKARCAAGYGDLV